MAEPSVINPITGTFPAQNGTRCTYGLFNRHGGSSSGLYASLNVGQNVGDQDGSALENRKRVKEFLAVPHLLAAKQVHGSGIYCLTEPLTADKEVEGFDALITDRTGVGLMIQQADCQAVLLFDPVQEVIGAVHCGWRGSVQAILARVIAVMTDNYGTVPANLQAMISPSLGPCCAEFVNYRQELPTGFYPFMVRDNHFDFWRISRSQLRDAGLVEQHIGVAEVCTCCSNDYFSYRRASRVSHGLTGRNCSVIVLRKEAD
ncbi:peptidoglycan editing factor PgeF [Desulfopila sp. IMCC35006]|uniref:peptidoglycan editing factor PgeF n=1 Tax=Desulfopila sp. IMCC35006 TaxID=2569542 RepID=UPI0010AC8972|nr:peptidoglycan editing factor PgeF [Desulfopila sp. IMCC35006]TKB27156.1 peptidoglycan editing factor PgeF [Desulfopila sp. IMCC35006]